MPKKAVLLALAAVLLAAGGHLPFLSGNVSGAQVADAEPTAQGAEQAATAEPATGEHATGEEPGAGGEEEDPVVPVLLGLVVILAAAKLGGELLERIGQPAVLGELIFGIVLGNLTLFGVGGLEFLTTSDGIHILAQIGVILLLFEVGLESNVPEMLSVGASSLLVAVLGVIAPFFLGWGVSAWLMPQEEMLLHVFIGATLAATSVGITARVLDDLGKIQARESKIILGAAVIDDVLGLVILAVVQGIIVAADSGGELALWDVWWILIKAILFLAAALVIGGWLSPHAFKLASKLRVRGILLVVSLIFAFGLAYLANVIGLATIVGAFAAGLILDEVHYRDYHDWGEHKIEELLRPLATFLVPVFFVWIGARVDLSAFGHVEILRFAAMLSLAAILGKMICALGVLEKGLDRISVAVGMVPRGEVGLIFASIGAGLVLHGEAVINQSVFGAVVIMVIVTTLITPPALQLTLARGDRIKRARSEQRRPRPGGE